MKKHAVTGCRPGQLFGVWAIHPQKFNEYFAIAKGVDLVALAESKAQQEASGKSESALAAKIEAALAKFKTDASDGDSDSMDGDSIDSVDDSLYSVDDGIAQISIDGPMTKYPTSFQMLFGGCSTMLTRYAIRNADRDPNVDAIMLRIDSPGGTVAGTSDLADAIAACSKPIYAYIEDMGCSAAYWCASRCDKVFANSTAIIGSIGTMLRLEDTSEMYKQDGVKVHIISTSPYKGTGADGATVTDDQMDDLQREVNEINDHFVAAVKVGREFTDEGVAAVADARCHIGANAQKLGLVDAIATYDDAMEALSTEAIRQSSERNRMNKEEFLKYAAENSIVLAEASSTLMANARAEGREEGRQDEIARITALSTTFKDRPAFALEQAVKGHDVPKAKSELVDVLMRENAELKAAQAQGKKKTDSDEESGVPGAGRGNSTVENPKAQIDAAIKAKMSANPRLRRADVVDIVQREHPEWFEALREQANQK